MNFLDLFLPVNLSSATRARAFLWLIYHYLEDPRTPNPFDDDYSRGNPGKVPMLARLTEEEASSENLDTVQELIRARELGAIRREFLETLVARDGDERRSKAVVPYPVPAPMRCAYPPSKEEKGAYLHPVLTASPEHYGHAAVRPRRVQSQDQMLMQYQHPTPSERVPPPERQMPLPMWPPLPVRQRK